MKFHARFLWYRRWRCRRHRHQIAWSVPPNQEKFPRTLQTLGRLFTICLEEGCGLTSPGIDLGMPADFKQPAWTSPYWWLKNGWRPRRYFYSFKRERYGALYGMSRKTLLRSFEHLGGESD